MAKELDHCKLHDQLIEKSTGKKAKASKKRKTIDEMSVTKEEFYLDFEMLGQLIRDDPSCASIKLPHETLGAFSILTVNDKIPAFRLCTKNLAFTQFKKQVGLGNAMSLVNPSSKKFENDEHCIAAYRQLILIMYYHIYRTTIRQLGLTWESFKSNEMTNLDLLREVGVWHSKGKEFQFVPVHAVLNLFRKQAIYQITEYDQIFQKQPVYTDPVECGYSKVGSYLTPTLNNQSTEVIVNQSVTEPLEVAVTELNEV